MRALALCILVACANAPAPISAVPPLTTAPAVAAPPVYAEVASPIASTAPMLGSTGAPPSAAGSGLAPSTSAMATPEAPVAIASRAESLVAPTVKELCAAVVRRAKDALGRVGGATLLPPKQPACEKTSLSVTGHSKSGALEVKASAIYVETGLSAASYLVLETPRGFVLTPVNWSYDARMVGKQTWQARNIEHIESTDATHFVAYLLGIDLSDSKRRDRRDVRGAYACELRSDDVKCAAYDPVEQAPLGVRIIPEGTPPAKVEDVPWTAPYRLVETTPGSYARVVK